MTHSSASLGVRAVPAGRRVKATVFPTGDQRGNESDHCVSVVSWPSRLPNASPVREWYALTSPNSSDRPGAEPAVSSGLHRRASISGDPMHRFEQRSSRIVKPGEDRAFRDTEAARDIL